MFSTIHLILILITFISVPLAADFIINQGDKLVDQCLKILAIVLLFFDPVYWGWEWMNFGKLNIETTLPFYLCSLFWILMPIAVYGKPGFVKRAALSNIATVGLFCGILGFVFNTHLNIYPIGSFVPVRSLLYHYFMIFVPVLLWKSGYYKPESGDEILAFIPVCLILIPGGIMNYLYGFDYGYTGGGIGTPLIHISSRMPRPLFLLGLYSLFYISIRSVFYGRQPFAFLANKRIR